MSILESVVAKFNELRGKKTDDLTQDRLDRCIPVAYEVLDAVAAARPAIGQITREQQIASYGDLVAKTLQICMEHNLLVFEVQFVFGLVLQALDNTQKMVQEVHTEQWIKAVDKKVWGTYFDQISLQQLDAFLKLPVDSIVASLPLTPVAPTPVVEPVQLENVTTDPTYTQPPVSTPKDN